MSPKNVPSTAKKPADHKAPKGGVFVYEHETGTITLPKFSELKMGILRKVKKLGDEEAVFFLFENLLSEDDLEVFDELTQEEAAELFSEWQADSEINVGESKAS